MRWFFYAFLLKVEGQKNQIVRGIQQNKSAEAGRRQAGAPPFHIMMLGAGTSRRPPFHGVIMICFCFGFFLFGFFSLVIMSSSSSAYYHFFHCHTAFFVIVIFLFTAFSSSPYYYFFIVQPPFFHHHHIIITPLSCRFFIKRANLINGLLSFFPLSVRAFHDVIVF